jgi:hypothetical protein
MFALDEIIQVLAMQGKLLGTHNVRVRGNNIPTILEKRKAYLCTQTKLAICPAEREA